MKATCRTERLADWNWSMIDELNRYNASSYSFAQCWSFKEEAEYATCTKCDIKGIVSALEPSQADIIIQEIDTSQQESGLAEAWHPVASCRRTSGVVTQEFFEFLWHERIVDLKRAPSCNFWPVKNASKCGDLPTWNFPDRVRWVQASFSERFGADEPGLYPWNGLFDGEPTRPSLPYNILPLFLTHPSLSKGDEDCQRRVRMNKDICRDAVGGPYLKAAFWDQIHFDPEHNRPRFPGGPIEIKGDISRSVSGKGKKRRRKRFLFTFLLLIFAAVATVAVVATVSSKLHDETVDLSNQINDRMLQATERSVELRKRINELSQLQTAQQQKLDRMIANMETKASLTDRRLVLMQKMIEKNRQLIL